MKKTLGFTILTIYVLIIPIITFYGYNSYFNIPYNYIEISPTNQTVFFFDLSRSILDVLRHVTLGGWLGIGATLIALIVILFLSEIARWIIAAGLVLFVLWLPFGFYRFGGFLASEKTAFYNAPSKCIPGATEDLYIAPVSFGGSTIFVPIDKTTHKLKNGLLVKEMSALSCQLEEKNIGKIQK